MSTEGNRGEAQEAMPSAAGLADSSPTSAVALWDLGDVPWLWGTRIRILFVIDGRITLGRGPHEFGLGLVLDTLRNPNFAWWVRFEVLIGDRDYGFRFTQDGFHIDDYDQVWFFGDWPGPEANNPTVGDDVIGLPENGPLDDAELRIVADWMERGGGVFATGDHSLLGASMCHRIPRVRTMRRWTRAQQVPSFAGVDRNETLVHGPGVDFFWEGDRWPQRILPVWQPDASPFLAVRMSPHPILCGRTGVIEHFPDHMHEGALFDDDEVRLNDPLDIPGYERDEYPVLLPDVLDPVSAIASGTTADPAAFGHEPLGVRPRPHVVAYGLTTTPEAAPRRFPMVGTYDGDQVGIGRVVVDSTWHHWFSYNLLGLRDLSPGYYAGMQDYYRNVALWLSSPEQRASMLFAATWGALVGTQPGAFDAALGIWGMGERVVDVIGRSAPQCILDELVATVAELPGLTPPGEPEIRSRFWALSRGTLNTLMVGGIAIRMVEQAQHHIKERAHGRESPFDPQAIRRLGLEGVAVGKRELQEGLAQGSERFRVMRDLLAEQNDQTTLGDIPVDRPD